MSGGFTLATLILRVLVDILDHSIDNKVHIIEAYKVLMSLNSILNCTILLRFLSVFRPLGVLLIVLGEMATDISNFSLLMGAVSVGFSICMAGMQSSLRYTLDDGLDPDSYYSQNGGFWVTAWSLFGEFDQTQYDWLTSCIMFSYMVTSTSSPRSIQTAGFTLIRRQSVEHLEPLG